MLVAQNVCIVCLCLLVDEDANTNFPVHKARNEFLSYHTLSNEEAHVKKTCAHVHSGSLLGTCPDRQHSGAGTQTKKRIIFSFLPNGHVVQTLFRSDDPHEAEYGREGDNQVCMYMYVSQSIRNLYFCEKSVRTDRLFIWPLVKAVKSISLVYSQTLAKLPLCTRMLDLYVHILSDTLLVHTRHCKFQTRTTVFVDVIVNAEQYDITACRHT
jgi:hypothetical protein